MKKAFSLLSVSRLLRRKGLFLPTQINGFDHPNPLDFIVLGHGFLIQFPAELIIGGLAGTDISHSVYGIQLDFPESDETDDFIGIRRQLFEKTGILFPQGAAAAAVDDEAAGFHCY